MKLHDFITKEKKLKARCIQDADQFTKGKIYWIQPFLHILGEGGTFKRNIPFEDAPKVRVINDEGKVISVESHIFALIK